MLRRGLSWIAWRRGSGRANRPDALIPRSWRPVLLRQSPRSALKACDSTSYSVSCVRVGIRTTPYVTVEVTAKTCGRATIGAARKQGLMVVTESMLSFFDVQVAELLCSYRLARKQALSLSQGIQKQFGKPSEVWAITGLGPSEGEQWNCAVREWLDDCGWQRVQGARNWFVSFWSNLATVAEGLTIFSPLVERPSDPPLLRWTTQTRFLIDTLIEDLHCQTGEPPFPAAADWILDGGNEWQLLTVGWPHRIDEQYATIELRLKQLEHCVNILNDKPAEVSGTVSQALQILAKGRPVVGKTLAKLIGVSEEHFRSRIVPRLKQAGVKNLRNGEGYILVDLVSAK